MEQNKKQYIINQFIQQVGYAPDIDNPKTFNEKLQWLKLYYHDPILTTCTDKYNARDYVFNILGEEYLIPLIDVYDDVKKICFNLLPNQFVLKLTCGSGEILICKDKQSLDIQAAKKKLEEWLKPETNHYFFSYEWCYKNIKPRITCEQYIEDNYGKLLDYKLFCFNGKVKYIQVDVDRFDNHTRCFYDLNWEKQPFTIGFPLYNGNIKKPNNLQEMLIVAEKLSKDFPHVRVDLYNINDNKIYFGELTYYHGNGMEIFDPKEWDFKLGEYLQLPAYPQVEINRNISISIPLKDFSSYEDRHDELTVSMLQNFTKKCDLFIDVGANYGYYSLLAADANKEVKIIAIEPLEDKLQILNINLTNSKIGAGRIKCINELVSSNSGKFKFYKSEASGNSSVLHRSNSETLKELELDSRSLDDILEHEQFDSLVVKIDANGNELEVLKGLSATFKMNEDITILLEMNHKMLELTGTSCEAIVEYLHAHDFSLYAIDDNEFRYYSLDVKENLEMMAGRYEKSSFNVLCVRKKRALNVVFFFHNAGLSGAERSLLDLLRGLSERGVLCTAILPEEGTLINVLKKSGYAVFELSKISGGKEAWQWAVLPGRQTPDDFIDKFADTFDSILNEVIPELKKISPDMIYSQTIVSPWGAVCANLIGVPHLLSVREYGVLDHNLRFFFGFKESVNALYESSAAVFTVTNDVRDTLFGTKKDKKITVVYSGLEIDHKMDISIETKTDDIIKTDFKSGVTVALLGTICRGKGQEDIVHACIELLKKGLNVRCVLAGILDEIDYYGQLIKTIKDSGFSDHFKIYSFMDDPYRIMKEVDIIISCSRREALGRTLLEAILLWKPIIYTNTGGSREVFTNGVHGLAYEVGNYHGLANNILLTINNIQETKKRVSSAREYVIRKFNTANYSGKIEEKLRALKGTSYKKDGKNAVIRILNSYKIDYIHEIVMQPRVFYANSVYGFKEEQCVLHEKRSLGQFSLNFELPGSGYSYLRLDLTKEYAIDIKIYKIVVCDIDGSVTTDSQTEIISNGENTGLYSWKYYHFDPQIIFKYNFNVKTIKFVGEVKKIDDEDVIIRLNSLLEDTFNQIAEKERQIAEKDRQIAEKDRQIHSLYYSYSYMLGRFITLIIKFKPLTAIQFVVDIIKYRRNIC